MVDQHLETTSTALNVSGDLGPVSERRLSENSEYVNPEMRETLGFRFKMGGLLNPGKQGKSSPFQKER